MRERGLQPATGREVSHRHFESQTVDAFNQKLYQFHKDRWCQELHLFSVALRFVDVRPLHHRGGKTRMNELLAQTTSHLFSLAPFFVLPPSSALLPRCVWVAGVTLACFSLG